MTSNPEIDKSNPPTGKASKYGSQPAACTLSKYVVKDVLRGAPNKPTVCMEPDIIAIPTTHKITCQTASLRSEEHTSELQSRGHLVCRLLLEKKNKQRP